MGNKNCEILVSVICTAYNQEKYIKDALDGFVMQKTNFKYEVFVHDDASTDNTAQIIKEYAEKYPHIIKPILQTENQYSKGVKIIKTIINPLVNGKYIATCEGDDFWCDENKLQKQVDFLESHPEFSASVHNTIFKNENTGESNVKFGNIDKEITIEDVVIGGNQVYQTSSLMYKKQDTMPDYMEKTTGAGDYPLAIYLTLAGKVMYFKDVMSVYRVEVPGSWTMRVARNTNNLIRHIKERIELLKAADEYYEYKHTQLFKKRIRQFEYRIILLEENYKKMVKEPYLELYKKESITFRFKCFIKRNFSFIVSLKRKFLRGSIDE